MIDPIDTAFERLAKALAAFSKTIDPKGKQHEQSKRSD